MKLANRVSVSFGVALLALVVIGVSSYRSTQQLTKTARWVEHSREVIGGVEALRASLAITRSSQRGYALTSEDSYLANFREARQGTRGDFENLKQLTADNPEQQRRLAELEPSLSERLALLDELVQLKKQAALTEEIQKEKMKQGVRLTDEIERRLVEVRAAESALRLQHEQRTQADSRRTSFVILLGIALSFVFVLLAGFRIRGDLDARSQAEEDLRKAHDELELRVQERTAKLASVNELLLHEIEQRKQAEEKSRKLNRVYSVLSEINQIIVRVRAQQTLLDDACQAAVTKGEFRMAWIGMLDQAKHTVVPTALAGNDDGYVRNLHLRLEGGPECDGPTATALREGRHIICNDMAREPGMAPWREHALRLGYRSSASFPLKKNGCAVGVFNLYATEPQFFDDDEIRLLDELAADISFALESIHLIEERERAEEALRKSESRLRGMFENTTLGIYRSTQDGRFLDVNPALVSMLGYDSREKLLAVSIAEDVYANVGDREHIIKAYVDVDSFENVPLQWKREDGKPISILVSGRAVRDERGAFAYFESFVEDVTERQAMEKQFYAAQKFEAIGHLAGGIAHDFNNVLCAILSWAELGMDSVPEGNKVRKSLQVIIEQARHAAGLTRQLLAFARRQHMEPRIVNLNNSVREVSTLLGSVIGRDIELKTSLAANIFSVLADPTHLEQVLMNLCVNARDAMPRGGKLIVETKNAVVEDDYCRLHPDAQPGAYVQLSVSDNGMGMDAATLDHIFEPFFTTKELGKGTGLGLATVYGIAKQHGGFIHSYSEVGVGTTFHVYFPACAGAAPKEKKAEAPALHGGSETILLAEDNEVLAASAREALERKGYAVLCARNGEEAVSLFELHRDRVGLLLFDVVMPKLNGPDAFLKIRANRKNVPVLFTSGHSFETSGLSSLVESGTELLQKPYGTNALLLKVRELLDCK